MNYPRLFIGLCALPGFLITFPSIAQIIPDAGRVLEQVESSPAPPASSDIHLQIEERPAMRFPEGESIQVERLRITGATVIPAGLLHQQVAEAEGRALTLNELTELAQRLTDFYRNKGYLLSRAYIPAQEIVDGVVEITVLEGHLATVRVDNSAGIGGAALAPLATIPTNEPLAAVALERALLLSTDVPGIAVRSTLAPGDRVGTSDLNINVSPTRRVTGFTRFDHHGNEYTGAARVGGTINFNNPLNIGDQLNLTALVSEADMVYLRGGYELPLNRWGTRAGLAYSHLDYELGEDFEALEADGAGGTASAYISHPLIRSHELNLNVRLQYDRKDLEDRLAVFDIETEKELNNWTLSFSGDLSDNWGGGAITAFALGYTTGDLQLDELSGAVDAISADTQGHFGKWNLDVQRLQRLTRSFSLYLAYSGQYSGGNLDSAEKMSLGGPHGVRAYPQGEAASDRAHLFTIEGRHDLRLPWSGHWQLTGFVDQGHARLSADPWTDDDNYRRLSGAGIGLNVSQPYGWSLRASIAWRLGDERPQSGSDKTPRFWLNAAKHF